MPSQDHPSTPRAKPRRRWVWGFGFLLLISLAWVSLPRNKEPHYRGRSLSQWAKSSDDHWNATAARDARHPAEAILQIGTNALPFLLDWIAQEQPKQRLTLKQKGIEAVSKLPLPSSLKVRLRYSSWNQFQKTDYQSPSFSEVLWCFDVLGSNAAPALPELSRLAAKNQWTISQRAVLALEYIGHPAFPDLLNLLTNYVCPTRAQVLQSLASPRMELSETDVRNAVPVLVRSLNDRDIAVARQAATSLGTFKAEPDLAVPALLNGLRDPNLAYPCVSALGLYGPAARSALPSLTKLLNTPDPELQMEVTTALHRIEPETVQLLNNPQTAR